MLICLLNYYASLVYLPAGALLFNTQDEVVLLSPSCIHKTSSVEIVQSTECVNFDYTKSQFIQYLIVLPIFAANGNILLHCTLLAL